jgi:hypothetical protein
MVSISLWYNRGEYDVSLQADSSNTLVGFHYNRHALLHISTGSNFFAYTIDSSCKDKDDCARDLIKNLVTEMLQRGFNYSGIMNQVQQLVTGPTLTSTNPNLTCYDSNQKIQQCGTAIRPGSCVISDRILESKRSVQCDTELSVGNAFISIYQSDSDYAVFDVHCNQSLCNSPSVLQEAKELMFKHKITATLDGRLVDTGTIVNDGSKLMVSMLLMIMIFLGLLSH